MPAVMTAKDTTIEGALNLSEHLNQLVQDLHIDLDDNFGNGIVLFVSIWDEYNCSLVDIPQEDRARAAMIFKAFSSFFNQLPNVPFDKYYLEVRNLVKAFDFEEIIKEVDNMFFEYAINTDDDPTLRRIKTGYYRSIVSFLVSVRLVAKTTEI